MTIYHFVRAVVEDPDQPGELLLDLGNDVCEIVGWQPGDEIEFIDNKDGSWTLKKKQDDANTITLDFDWDDACAASDTYVFSDMSGTDTITLGSGSITMPNVYITNTTSGVNWDSSLWSNDLKPNSTLSLKGEGADIDINGESLMTMIRGIQERLNILCPDPGMEEEWVELREIRAQYEAKLQECREKSKMWKILNK